MQIYGFSNLGSLGINNSQFSNAFNNAFVNRPQLNIPPPIFNQDFQEYNPLENPANDYAENVNLADDLRDFYKKDRGFGYSIECLTLGQNCPDSVLGNVITNTSDLFKKVGLMILAITLLAFGLYSLISSTETGKAALNAASKL